MLSAEEISKQDNDIIQKRYEEIASILAPKSNRIQELYLTFSEHFTRSLSSIPTTNKAPDESIPDIRIIDTLVNSTSTTSKKEFGDFYSLCIEANGIRASRIEFNSCGTLAVHEDVFEPFSSYILSRKPESEQNESHQKQIGRGFAAQQIDARPYTLEDFSVTATVFVETVKTAIEKLIEELKAAQNNATSFQFVLVSSYPLEKHGIRAEFLLFHEICAETLATNDPLERVDLIYLCNVFLSSQRPNLNAFVIGALSSTSAGLLAALHEAPDNIPRCLVNLELGDSIRFSYVEPNANENGFQGDILDVDLAYFNGNHIDPTTYCKVYGLPYTVPDFEMSALRSSLRRRTFQQHRHRDFENMTSARCIPELCRRMILRIFQSKTPKPVWVLNSLGFKECLSVLEKSICDEKENTKDDGISIEETKLIFRENFGWSLNDKEANLIERIIMSVFNRSAALVAICVAFITKETGRLQPALGGVTMALSGSLGSNLKYQQLLRIHLNNFFNRDTSQLIVFYNECTNSGPKGAALIGSQLSTCMPST